MSPIYAYSVPICNHFFYVNEYFFPNECQCNRYSFVSQIIEWTDEHSTALTKFFQANSRSTLPYYLKNN